MFQNRADAGRQLAARLSRFKDEKDVLIAALPRGGVPVAAQVADALGAELDVCLVRKLGVPWQPELAFGALAEEGIRVLDSALVRECGLDETTITRIADAAQGEMDRRGALFRGSRPPANVRGRLVIAVDDGLATGSTMLAAIRALRARGADRIVAAIPVAPPSTCRMLEREADEVVCLETHEPFYSVGSWYEDFEQVEDSAVQQELQRRRARL